MLKRRSNSYQLILRYVSIESQVPKHAQIIANRMNIKIMKIKKKLDKHRAENRVVRLNDISTAI